jgi:hypothetical protein
VTALNWTEDGLAVTPLLDVMVIVTGTFTEPREVFNVSVPV